MSIATALGALYQTFQSQNPRVDHSTDWPSPCEQGEPDAEQMIAWQAVARTPAAQLDELASALELQFPAELSAYYGSYFGPNIATTWQSQPIELLQAWSLDDYVRLQENITGHILMKRRLKQPATVFIGLTAEDDLLISVDVATGSVGLERVGKPQHHQLAESLSVFLTVLQQG
ncbi:SecY-interacting protein [Pseudoalteromonas fenneropenaei]|uniref:SecY-interacting protein n=1 Tax=Pseudoalteromonas fenneropenaei TaxID=1737459 RepID=A0ABV7CHQ2_9GAMM